MATWEEIRAAFAPPSVRFGCIAGPRLREEEGMFALDAADPVLGLAWSADSRLLASASGGRIDGAEGVVRVAEPATGRTWLLLGHARGVHTVAFHRGGWLATAGHDGAVGLWDLDRGVGFPIAGPRPRHRVAFVGDLLLIGDELPPDGESSRFAVVDLAAPSVVLDVALPVDHLVHLMAASPDGTRVVVHLFHAYGTQRVECRSLPGWDLVWEHPVEGVHVNGLAWPDGGIVWSESRIRDRALCRRDAATGEIVARRPIAETMMGALDVDAARGRVATIGADGILALWTLAGFEPMAELELTGWRGSAVALSPDGLHAAIGSATGEGTRILSLP